MDYEKKYNEALARARKIHDEIVNNEVIGFPGQIKEIFPELRESEDERIRRALVEYFSPEVQLDFVRGVPIQKIRDWLEKQKDHFRDDTKMVELQDYFGFNDLERAIHRGFLSAGVENVPIAIIKETAQECLAQMKHVEPSDEELVRHPPIAYTYPSDASRNEQLKMALLALLNSDLIKVAGNKFTKQDLIDWVERIPTDKPTEWSEEDEKMRTNAVLSLMYLIEECPNADFIDSVKKEIAWLKSLRPHSHWKPSEEQMEHLKRCFSHGMPHLPMPNQHVLESLYNDLKKLMLKP